MRRVGSDWPGGGGGGGGVAAASREQRGAAGAKGLRTLTLASSTMAPIQDWVSPSPRAAAPPANARPPTTAAATPAISRPSVPPCPLECFWTNPTNFPSMKIEREEILRVLKPSASGLHVSGPGSGRQADREQGAGGRAEGRGNGDIARPGPCAHYLLLEKNAVVCVFVPGEQTIVGVRGAGAVPPLQWWYFSPRMMVQPRYICSSATRRAIW